MISVSAELKSVKGRMSSARTPLTYKGRSLGIIVLVAVQLLVGAIHVLFGLWLLSAPRIVPLLGQALGPDVYSVYTVAFGVLTLIFTSGIWLERSWGWIGTVAVSIFVIVADSLTLLDLPSIPGIPKFAAVAEIAYGLGVLLYLSQFQVRARYKASLTQSRK
jgi:hypothetical protein